MVHADLQNTTQINLAPNGGTIQPVWGVGPGGSNVVPTDAAIAAAVQNTGGVGPLTAAALRTIALVRSPVSLADYGLATSNTAAQNRTALQAAATDIVANGHNEVVFPSGAYSYSHSAENTALMSFTGLSHLHIKGIGDVTLTDTTVHTAQAGYTAPFKFDGCKDVSVTGLTAVGGVLASPLNTTTGLGYTGGTFVRAVNGCVGVTVDARLTNWRYGVQTGDYGDYTAGSCSGFDVKVRGGMVGYPIAAYFADGINLDVDVDGIHRVAYLGGCQGVRVRLRYKDQYIAPYALYMTSCITSGTDAVAQVAPPANPTTSRGCADVEGTIADKGSTVFTTDGALIGIGLERVDATEHKNIKVNGYVVGTDTLSTTTGLVHIISANAPAVWSRYADEFTSSIVFRDIEIGGVCDHSAQTANGNAVGDIFVRTVDLDNAAAYATVRNVTVKAKLRKGSGTHQPIYFQAPGLGGSALLAVDAAGTVDATVYTNATSTVDLSGAKIKNLSAATGLDAGGSRVHLGPGADVATRTDGTYPQRYVNGGGMLAGAGARIIMLDAYVNLTGASVTSNPAIPGGALVLGWSGRVTTTITGPASGNYKVGTGTTADKFLAAGQVGNTAGTTFGPQHRVAGTVSPEYFTSTTSIVYTSVGSNFTAGQIHFVIWCMVFDVPTS